MHKKDGDLCCNHLAEAMQEYNRAVNPNGGNKDDNENEIDLGAFDGICYKCKK